jgi:ABC-type multidrug transport system fused ATPase/permease subunit
MTDPSTTPGRSERDPRTFGILLTHFDRSRGRMAAVVVLSVLYAGLEALGIAALLPLLERISDGGAVGDDSVITRFYVAVLDAVGLEGTTPNLLVVIAALFLISAAVQFLSLYLGAAISLDYRFQMTSEIFRGYATARWDYVMSVPTGTAMSHMNGEVARAASFLQIALTQVSHVVFIVILLVAAFWVSPALTALAIGFVGAAMVAVVLSSKKMKRAGTRILGESRKLFRATNQYMSGYKTVRAYAAFDCAAEVIDETARNREAAEKRVAFIDSVLAVFPELILLLVIFAVVLIADQQVGASLPELGVIVALLLRISQRAKNLRGVAKLSESYPTVKSLQGIRRGLHHATAQRLEEDGRAVTMNHEVRFDRVSYSYPTRPHVAALDSVDLRIRKGEMVGIVGSSGAGKSTLTALLLGMLDPDSGSVTVDGVPLSRIGERGWLRNVGYVPQEPFLLDSTIRENITFFRAPSDRDLNAAAEKAQVRDFIESLPDGYDTIVGNNAVELSGGQRQRICLARALYSTPPLLVLDEATSSLDTGSETAINDAIAGLRHTVTIVVIAHRLSTLDAADTIVVLEDGRVVEHGERVALTTADDSRFRAMLQLQQITT